MPLQIAPKLKAKAAEKWMAALAGHLYPGEFVWALARTTVMRPPCDGLAVTNARVLAFSGRDVAAKGPKRAVDADNISRFDLPTFGAAKQLVITTRDNQRLYFGILQDADVAFVSHYVHHLGRVGRADLPPGMRGAHQPKQEASGAEPGAAIQPKSDTSADAQRETEERAAADQPVGPAPNGQKSTKAGKVLLGIAVFVALLCLVGLLAAITTDEEGLNPEAAVPNVAGQNLSEAMDLLASTGLQVETIDASGNDRTVIVESNWQVVTQSIVAGDRVGDRKEIVLGVLKHDEIPVSTPAEQSEPEVSAIAPTTTAIPTTTTAIPTTTTAIPTTTTAIPTTTTAIPTTTDPAPRFSGSMVRARGVTREHLGGQSNVRFVAGTDDINQIKDLTEQCIDYFLKSTRAAYCYGYGNDADFEVKTPDWTPEFDSTAFGGSRPCWITFGGQPPAGPDSRKPTQVTEEYEYRGVLQCPGTVQFP
ncbi:PASTA domain-containing protein [Rhodococcus sp. NPDC059968]|uniref:PASTA domain-containing protein n=1 Tax=Rhodococcus sp. NPDC059968 TaxID=3347017 RepID=UPI00367286C0